MCVRACVCSNCLPLVLYLPLALISTREISTHITPQLILSLQGLIELYCRGEELLMGMYSFQ